MKFVCPNCGPVNDLRSTFPDIPHLLERILPGEPVPEGECAQCDALVHRPDPEPGGAELPLRPPAGLTAYWLTTDVENSGTETSVFFTRDERDQAFLDWMRRIANEALTRRGQPANFGEGYGVPIRPEALDDLFTEFQHICEDDYAWTGEVTPQSAAALPAGGSPDPNDFENLHWANRCLGKQLAEAGELLNQRGDLLNQCPDLPDDFNAFNPDATDAFKEAFLNWKAKVIRASHGLEPAPSAPSAESADARRQFTVLLLYPDHATENYGQDTYCTTVTAADPASAIQLARQACDQANGGTATDPSFDPLDDLHVLAVFPGHLTDLNP